MKFIPAGLDGASVIELEKLEDERGYFARTWCRQEFAAHGLETNIVQTNTSYNRSAGTLRGMHYQLAPHEETKLVRCTRGALYDVIVDLRPRSSQYKQWIGVELNADNGRMLYIPAGFAHGFITLTDDTEIAYMMSAVYVPDAARGFRWDDPGIGIEWPAKAVVMSDRDKALPQYQG